MSAGTYASLVDLAAGLLLLSAVLVVWRRDLRAATRLLAVQGAALGAIPVLAGIRARDAHLLVVGAAVIALRAVVFPRLVAARLRGAPSHDREGAPVVNTATSLLVTALLVTAAYALGGSLVHAGPSSSARAAPVGFALVLVGVFLLATRRHALSQVVALLLLDNGIDAVAFLASHGVPPVVELGASLDVLLAIVILGVLAGRMHEKFGGTDLDDLRELHE
ncbi:MAG: hypothetical protein M0Z33_03890 [Actinomycetota bacterium]|nr:hypothetical protein [Actinomycetota bacterium]